MVTSCDVTSREQDTSLRLKLSRLLAEQHFDGLRAIAVSVQDGQITLRGRVTSFYQKQLCIHCYQRVQASGSLIDCIDVAY